MFTVTTSEAEINAHTDRVRVPDLRCGLAQCPKCRGVPGGFHFHERRRRSFRLIVDGLVRIVASFLARWRCPLCRQTFTEYPPFALPRKRYVRGHPFAFADRYLDDDRQSYRRAARGDDGSGFGYPCDPEAISARQLDFTTVWRWTGFAGALDPLRRHVARLVREKDPASGLFREVRPVPSRKCRSPARRGLLLNGLRLFAADREYRRLFGFTIFPTICNTRLLLAG